MTKTEALRLLRLGTASERLEAARYLSETASPGDLRRLTTARQREVDHYVTVALDEAIRLASRATASELPQGEEAVDEAQLLGDEYARGYREAMLTVVHELSTSVGRVRSAATNEIPKFDDSTTRRRLDRVEGLLHAVERLSAATGTPELEEFDLAGLVMDIGAAISDQTGIPVDPAGPEPLMLTSDPSLIDFAVTNGIRNACESVAALPQEEQSPVTVSWGTTDRDSWVSVIDRGIGLPEDLQDPFAFAETRKEDHLGVGLALARRSVRSLGGSVTLQGRGGGGALFEFRWPHATL